ncbi:hypothetical protein HRbin06_00631 [archaeon HR06]|nr:hypothetical protein HRbin06_00631 [archaeon HR06]
MQREELKKNIIKLLEEDKEFRYTVEGIIGYREILRRLEEHDRKFNEVIEELKVHRLKLEDHDKKFNEVIEELKVHRLKLEEHDKKFNEVIEELKRHTLILQEHTNTLHEHTLILQEHSKLLKEHTLILQEHSQILKSHDKSIKELTVGIGSMGNRMGRGLQKMVLEIYRDQLLQLGINPNRARRFRYIDKEGKLGLKGRNYEFDIVVSNDFTDVLEVKSYTDLDKVEWFNEKVEIMIKMGILKKVRRKVLVSIHIDGKALKRAEELGIVPVYGYVV